MLSACLKNGNAQNYWNATCIMIIYKENDDQCECARYEEISLVNTLGKVYGKIIIQDAFQ